MSFALVVACAGWLGCCCAFCRWSLGQVRQRRLGL